MSVNDTLGHVRSRRLAQAIEGAGTDMALRGTNRGELVAMLMGKPKYTFCDEGSYFVATNPTPGTAIDGIAGTGAFSDAESLLHIKNNYTVGEDVRLYLDYLRLAVVTAGTNGTDHRFVMKTDTAGRYTSGGSSITPVNPNQNSSRASSAVVKFGALVTAAATANARLQAQGLIRNVICVANDHYTFDFGGEVAVPVAHAVAGTAIAHIVIPVPPIVLGPQEELIVSLFATSQTVASAYEFALGYWER